MSVEEIASFTTSDGYAESYRRYSAANPRGRLVFIHGIQSHGGWYTRSCAEIAEAGYEVFFLDRRGAGLNQNQRGDAPSFRRLLDDLSDFLASLPKSPGKTALAGISWGGKLATAFPYRHPGRIDNLLLLCPGFFPRVQPPFFQRLWIARCRFRRPTRMFPVPLSDAVLFTESKEGQEFIANDPLATRRATARFLLESFNLDIYLKRAVKRVTVPLLLLLAGKDKIIFNAKTRRWIERKSRSADRTILEYPNAGHTLEFEEAGHPFVRDIIEWLKQRD